MKKTGFALLMVCCGYLLPAQTADSQYDRSKYKEAEEAYRKSLKEDTNVPGRGPYNLGNAQYQQGKYQESADQYRESLKNAPDKTLQADAWHNLGNAQFKQQDYQGAINAYSKSLRLLPGDADTKKNLLLAKRQLNEQQQRQQPQQQEQPPPPQPQENEQPQGQQPQDAPPPSPPPGQAQTPQAKNLDEARRFLETAVDPEDQRSSRKYREGEPSKKPAGGGKDW